MIKLLIGGSPCTYWSIAQKNGRETEASGIGWELFKNYLIAKKKFNPDYFLYENNKSAAQPIKDQISRELGVPQIVRRLSLKTQLVLFQETMFLNIFQIWLKSMVYPLNRLRLFTHGCSVTIIQSQLVCGLKALHRLFQLLPINQNLNGLSG